MISLKHRSGPLVASLLIGISVLSYGDLATSFGEAQMISLLIAVLWLLVVIRDDFLLIPRRILDIGVLFFLVCFLNTFTALLFAEPDVAKTNFLTGVKLFLGTLIILNSFVLEKLQSTDFQIALILAMLLKLPFLIWQASEAYGFDIFVNRAVVLNELFASVAILILVTTFNHRLLFFTLSVLCAVVGILIFDAKVHVFGILIGLAAQHIRFLRYRIVFFGYLFAGIIFTFFIIWYEYGAGFILSLGSGRADIWGFWILETSSVLNALLGYGSVNGLEFYNHGSLAPFVHDPAAFHSGWIALIATGGVVKFGLAATLIIRLLRPFAQNQEVLDRWSVWLFYFSASIFFTWLNVEPFTFDLSSLLFSIALISIFLNKNGSNATRTFGFISADGRSN